MPDQSTAAKEGTEKLRETKCTVREARPRYGPGKRCGPTRTRYTDKNKANEHTDNNKVSSNQERHVSSKEKVLDRHLSKEPTRQSHDKHHDNRRRVHAHAKGGIGEAYPPRGEPKPVQAQGTQGGKAEAYAPRHSLSQCKPSWDPTTPTTRPRHAHSPSPPTRPAQDQASQGRGGNRYIIPSSKKQCVLTLRPPHPEEGSQGHTGKARGAGRQTI